MDKPETIKAKATRNKRLMLVRYGCMGLCGWFEHQENQVPKLYSRVVVKSNRGLELGEIVGPSCYRSGQFKLTPEQVEEYLHKSGSESPLEREGQFIRYATTQDISEEKHLEKSAKDELECCRKFAKELGLPMEVVACEHLFGGERIVFYFVADGRIDFRELVKQLAKEYQTRIEMRQIGSRDEAKLQADYEACGRECCCKQFLRILKPVTMRMAKLQKATLDPSKISGHCGRLKCCLRYEDETYRELKARLPRKNSLVKTPYGEGRVADMQILTQLVVVQKNDGVQIAVPVEEVEIISEGQITADNGKSETDSDQEEGNISGRETGEIKNRAAGEKEVNGNSICENRTENHKASDNEGGTDGT